MIASRLKRYRKAGGHHSGHGMPALIPMIDMLVILVVYMLVHTADYEILPNGITVPPEADAAGRDDGRLHGAV